MQLLVHRVEKLGCTWAREEGLRCGVPLGHRESGVGKCRGKMGSLIRVCTHGGDVI